MFVREWPAAKTTARALVSAAVGAGLIWSVVGCQSDTSEAPETTTTTTTVETTAPETAPAETPATGPEATEPTVAPTTKGSLDPLPPGIGEKRRYR